MGRVTQCPHCGSTEGLYRHYTLYHIYASYNYDGRLVEEDLDDAYERKRSNMYCISCNKFVCKYADLLI